MCCEGRVLVGIWGVGCLNRRAEHGSTHGGRMPDTAASAAAPNGAIYLCREYLIIGDPMRLDAWGGRMPDTAMSIAAVNSITRGPHCA